jgi:hypothetical protein
LHYNNFYLQRQWTSGTGVRVSGSGSLEQMVLKFVFSFFSGLLINLLFPSCTFYNYECCLLYVSDTSFLEFCIKQTTVEAEMLLQENIGSLDCNHEFIDNFLNYKAFLSAEVIEMAFRAPSARGDGAARSNPGVAARGGTSADMEMGGGGKKRGKKGKKVSAAVLGFNVVSNRIMMGEIQNVD